MQIEVYKQTKPPLQRRPIVVSSLLMLLAGALAAQLTFSRQADPLGRTLRLIELDCAIRPPRGFSRHPALVGVEWRVQPFQATAAPWGRAQLAVWYTRIEHTQGLELVAHSILEQLRDPVAPAEQSASLINNDGVLLGAADALELQDPRAGLVVRVRELPIRGYLAVSISAERPMDDWLDRFDATCRSVQIAP